MRLRRKDLRGIIHFLLPVLVGGWLALQPGCGQPRSFTPWPSYGADTANTKYSPLDQINRQNFDQLKIVWRWVSPGGELLQRYPQIRVGKYEATPLMIHGVLYTSGSLSQVCAIDAETGRTLWVYDPQSWLTTTSPPGYGFIQRGVCYWTDGRQERIFAGTGDAFLVAIDAKTGQAVRDFGAEGKIDLTLGLDRPVERRLYTESSPPIVCRGVVVIGSAILDQPVSDQMPLGDVRGFDVQTGKLLWTFHTIPHPGELGNDTWKKDSWKRNGAVNAWSILSADEESGYLYLPLSTPSNDHYGGNRPGDGLFGDSLVCLEAKTGRLIWHFQMVHHGLWDYDLPAAPILSDLNMDGKRVKAVAQVTKQGFCFLFDRITGKPLWPIEERPVPQSEVPGESSSQTQPVPTRPAPFDRQGLSKDDLIDFTPELRKEAEEILSQYAYGPLYFPPALRPTLLMPGTTGGASWAGAGFDPETGMLFIPSITRARRLILQKPGPAFSPDRYAAVADQGPTYVVGPRGLPLTKPPYGRVTAIDLKNGERLWMVPMGEGPRKNPALAGLSLPPLGWYYRGFPLLTKSLLLIAQEGTYTSPGGSPGQARSGPVMESVDPSIQAFDKMSGELIAKVPLPANAQGAPMTYAIGAKQYIVVPIGGGKMPAELIAFALP